MVPYTKRETIRRRLAERLPDLVTPFEGTVFRFVDPKFSSTKDLFAGKGSDHANSRWFLKGSCLATYTSLQVETALAEAFAANRYYRFPDENRTPILLVTASAKLRAVVDLREGMVRNRLRVSEETILGTDWRMENSIGRESVTQAWGWALYQNGVNGFLTASAAWPKGSNLVVFPTRLGNGNTVRGRHAVEWPRP